MTVNKIFQNIILPSLMMGIVHITSAQMLKGEVNYWDEDMKMEMPLPATNVYWLNTTNATTADEAGKFKIQQADSLPAKLVLSFVGYQNDTLLINDASY